MLSLNRNKEAMLPVLLSGGLGITQLLLQLQRNSQNHRIVWVGKDLKDHPVPTPLLLF